MAVYEYDVAVSFASSERGLAEDLASRLRSAGIRTFYDDFSPELLWGKDLLVHFDEVFRQKSRYCVIFVSRDYAERMWTNHERRSAQARGLEEREEYILPIQVDETRLPGMPPTIGYLSLKQYTIRDIAELLIKKLQAAAAEVLSMTGRPPVKRHPFKHEDLTTYTLNEWVAEFHQIYYPINRQRSPSGIWCHVVEHAASIHEDLRIADYRGVLDHLPRVFCWMCGFIMRASSADTIKLSPSLEDIILSKFPRQCFYCGACPCVCAGGAQMQDLAEKKRNYPLLKDRALKRKAKLVADDNVPRSLSDFVAMMGQIFGHRNYDMPDVVIVAHFQEEIGEVAQDMNKIYNNLLLRHPDGKATTSDLEDEIADAFTWMVAIYRKVDYILGGARDILERRKDATDGRSSSLGVPFEELIWRVYARDRAHMVDPTTGERPLEPITPIEPEPDTGP